MGKSQAKRLREATQRFGREDWSRWAGARQRCSMLVFAKKKEAGVVAPTAVSGVFAGPTLVKRYCSSLSYEQNELTYGRIRK